MNEFESETEFVTMVDLLLLFFFIFFWANTIIQNYES